MRLDGIDLLRGIAVIAVILYHFFVLLGLTQNDLFPYVHTFGSLGVPLFFIISGFLIYRSIDRSISRYGTKKGLLNYGLHRLFRIIPAYYFNLFIVLLLAGFVMDNTYYYSASFFRQFFNHLTFMSYFVDKSSGFGINGAYWTLSVEMLWYLAAPLLLFFLKRTPYLLMLAVASLFYIWLVAHGRLDSFFGLEEYKNHEMYQLQLSYYISQLPGQINYFIAGILIYRYGVRINPARTYRNYLVALASVLLFIRFYHYSPDFLFHHLLILSVTTVLFVFLYTTRIKGGSLIEWIGKISYSLYLWHMPILFVMNRSHILQYRNMFETILFFLILLFFLSSFSYYFIEEGGFALRGKIAQKIFGRRKETQNA